MPAKQPLTLTRIKQIPGYLAGMRCSSLLVAITLTANPPHQPSSLHTLSRALEKELGKRNPSLTPVDLDTAGHNPLLYLCRGLAPFFSACNLPVFEQVRVVSSTNNSAVLALPVYAFEFKVTNSIFRWLLDAINVAMAKGDLKPQFDQLPSILDQTTDAARMGSNTPRFLRAAFDANIPTTQIAGSIYQFGQGANARWLDSSFTDETPHISTYLAKKKQLAATILRQAGLPVANHFLVKSAGEATERAMQLGYPVVIKPADRDGGVAVAAGLTCAEEVIAAFAEALAVSPNVLVEKHIDGRDYRINVFANEMLWAIERIPAGVTGDGVQSIRELVTAANLDPRRGEDKHALLQKLVVDDEALKVLGHAQLSPDSIPEKGQFVALRRRANIAMGGVPVAVPMNEIHPDNRKLALRATAALRLDLAGIDLLLPDIRRSWRETGGAVCEVNAQPQLGGVTSTHTYHQVLDSLVPNRGRIPIALVVGSPPAPNATLGRDIHRQLCVAGVTAGLASPSGVAVGDYLITEQGSNAYRDGRMLVADRNTQAAVLYFNDVAALGNGLPFDRYDILILTDTGLGLPTGTKTTQAKAVVNHFLQWLLPACTGQVYILGNRTQHFQDLWTITPAQWLDWDDHQAPLAPKIATELISVLNQRLFPPTLK